MESSPIGDYKELENSSFLFKLRIVLIAGVGFFTDAYDLFTINYVAPMLGYVYYYDQPHHQLPSLSDSLIKAAATWGSFFGQIIFGYLADTLGRKRMYGIELIIIIFATVCSSLSADLPAGINVLVIFGLWRFVLGVGIGGDYPLSSVLTSENASVKRRGTMIAIVFGMQGLGMLASGVVGLICLSILKDAIKEDISNVDYLWRICILMGVVPAIIALYYRLTMGESPRYEALQKARQENQAIKQENGGPSEALLNNSSEEVTFWEFVQQWQNLKVLLGCSLSWFALDVAFYGANLNQSYVIEIIGFTGNGDTYDKLQMLILGNLTIVCLGTFPGYYFTAWFVDKWGRLPIQFMGFIISGICWLVLGAAYDKLSNEYSAAFIAVYTIAMFFLNFGPNSTTFILPGESFPTKFRSRCHGISAATGKLGAILAAQCFSLLKENPGVAFLMYVFAGFMLLGVLFSFLCFETKGKSLEELEKNFILEKKKKQRMEC